MNADQAAVLQYYAEHDKDNDYENTWGYGNPVAADYWHERDRLVFSRLRPRLLRLRRSFHVLEIGVGHGHELAKFARQGISDVQLTGIDLVYNRLVRARINYPRIRFTQGDATRLAFADGAFDVVCQFTCAMHASSKSVQKQMCAEMIRVTKPGGLILWWDIHPVSWRTLFVRQICSVLFGGSGLRKLARCMREGLIPARRKRAIDSALPAYILPVARKDLASMFPGSRVRAQSVGLDFAIWESLWTRSRWLARLLWHSGWLSQHCFALIEKGV